MGFVFLAWCGGLQVLGGLDYGLDDQGLPSLSVDGAKALEAKMPFWGDKWQYASVSMHPEREKAHQWQGTCKGGLTFALDSTWSFSQAGRMVGTFNLDVPKTTKPAIGGGLEFTLPLQKFKDRFAAKDPVLLDEGAGLEWAMGEGRILRLTFSPKLPKVYFERGQKRQIRCMMFDGAVPAGRHTFTLTVSLPAGSRYRPGEAERYGSTDSAEWLQGALHPTKAFVDLSDLNHTPAGKFGFVKAVGDEFRLANGTPIRFWGANVQAYSLFMEDRELIQAHAKRLAALGFNLVRLHHMDSQTWVRTCLVKMGPTSQDLDPEALDTYFYWIKCLKDEGIYVWIDLHVGRPFRDGDAIPGFDEVLSKARSKTVGAEFKGYCYVNDRVRELMQLFNEKLVTSVNPYTGTALKDEPAVMTFMLTNENDLTHHFGNALLGDKRVPAHHALFQAKARTFAAKHGLDAGAVQQTWVPGVSKILLNDMEYRWNVEMIEHLRGLGVSQPIDTGHMWGGNPLFSLPALVAGDMIDVHTYYHGKSLTQSPRLGAGSADYIARSQVVGMPLTITEWNNEDRAQLKDPFVLPVLVGAMAAFQGWDAPMLYGYSQDRFNARKFSEWSSHNIPGIMGMMPAVALMYRQQHVRGAEQIYVARLSRETMLMRGQGNAEPAFSTLSLMHKVVVALPAIKELPWLEASKIPVGTTVFTDLEKDFIPPGQTHVESDTGELRRDWEKGILTIDTEKTQGAVGWLRDERVKLRDVQLHIENPKAAVLVTSLDNRPIAISKRMLITAMGRVDRKQLRSEPITGSLVISSRASGMTLYSLAGDGSKKTSVKLAHTDGRFGVSLKADLQTHWFLLEAE